MSDLEGIMAREGIKGVLAEVARLLDADGVGVTSVSVNDYRSTRKATFSISFTFLPSERGGVSGGSNE